MYLQAPSPLERLLARLWDDVLGTDASNRLTNFFNAGGGDVEAARLLTLVGNVFRVEMPVAALHAAPTVAAFADALKYQVDHPGRLERLAERLLPQRLLHGGPYAAAQRGAHRAGAS